MQRLLKFMQRLGLQLLQTGQVAQYSGELDDGFYEAGVPKAYVVVATGQYAGTTNITVAARTDVHSNECARDRNTGLMWSRTRSASTGPGADGQMAWTGAADDIFAYCAQANLVGLAGHSDWRVPNVTELLTLVNYEAPNGNPDPIAFPTWPTAAEFYWTSTTYPSGVANAFRVQFSTGDAHPLTKVTAAYVILVRNG